MSIKKPLVPESKEALNQYKMKMAKELSLDSENPADVGHLASFHTGIVTRKLVEAGEKLLMDKYNTK